MKQWGPLKKKIKNQKSLLKNQQQKNKTKSQTKFFISFSILYPKRCPGGRRLHPQRPQRVFEEDEA